MKSRHYRQGGKGRGRNRFTGLLSLHEAAKVWGVDDSTVRKAISSGRLVEGRDAKKFGKQWVVTEDGMAREFSALQTLRKLKQEVRFEQEAARIMESLIWPD